MSTGVWSNHLLLHVCCNLSLRDVLLRLSLANTALQKRLKSLLPSLLRAYVANGSSLLPVLCLPALQLLITSPLQLLKFKPLYYNGGVSNLEILASFESMWEYSGTNYSTYYEEGEGELRTNRLCAAYFAGVEAKNLMSKRFHYDLNIVTQFPHFMNRSVLELFPAHSDTALTFDIFSSQPIPMPLPDSVLITPEEWDIRVDKITEAKNAKGMEPVLEKRFIYRPEAQAVAVVREVSVARPLNYTGAVQTLMVLAGTRQGSEYHPEEFKKWENIDSVEKARMVDGSQSPAVIDNVTYIEYTPAAEDYYPLLWVQFSDLAHNHVRVPLSRPHAIRQTTVILYTIEDRREEYELLSMQPNFDVMFVVFRGAVARGVDS